MLYQSIAIGIARVAATSRDGFHYNVIVSTLLAIALLAIAPIYIHRGSLLVTTMSRVSVAHIQNSSLLLTAKTVLFHGGNSLMQPFWHY